MIDLTFAVSGLLGGAAGVLVGVLYALSDEWVPMPAQGVGGAYCGVEYQRRAWPRAWLWGLRKTLPPPTFPRAIGTVIAFLVMILVLVIKPTGLLGFKFDEKV